MQSLPPLLLFNDFNGVWANYEDALYQIFLDEVVNGNLSFLGLKIKTRFLPSTKNKHFVFWHLISDGKEEEKRLPDIPRCERIRWISFVIKNANDKNLVACWENQRSNKKGNNQNIVLWFKSQNYVVILEKRKNYLLLKTAYLVKYQNAEKALLEEMNKSSDPR